MINIWKQLQELLHDFVPKFHFLKVFSLQMHEDIVLKALTFFSRDGEEFENSIEDCVLLSTVAEKRLELC